MSSAAQLFRGIPEPGAITGGVVATIGVFDGVHVGHQRLLAAVADDHTRGTGVLITFDPHPRCVLDRGGCPPLLTSVVERAALAARHGVGATIAVEFTRELSTWTAERFCERLVESMPLRRLVVGPGFALGRERAGDEAFLRAYGAGHGFDVVSVQPVLFGGERVASGRVRRALLDGNVAEAAGMLGRLHHLPGTVVRGDGRGRTLGFPTANVDAGSARCIPGAGVYATWLRVGHRWLRAATGIGVRPTFGGDTTTVEAFILDFDEDIYGAAVELQFVARLREERAYPDAESLVAQMHADVDAVRAMMAELSAPVPMLA